jgi:hypothetical protein
VHRTPGILCRDGLVTRVSHFALPGARISHDIARATEPPRIVQSCNDGFSRWTGQLFAVTSSDIFFIRAGTPTTLDNEFRVSSDHLRDLPCCHAQSDGR